MNTTIPDDVVGLLEREVMFTYLGTTLSMLTLTDGSRTETFCFVAGAPVLYRVCAAIFMLRLYGFDLTPPEEELGEGMKELWGKIRLPQPIVNSGVSRLTTTRMMADKVIAERVADVDAEVRKQKMIAFIDEIEGCYVESLSDPISISVSIDALLRDETITHTWYGVAKDIYSSITAQI